MTNHMELSRIHIANVIQPRGGEINNDTVVEYTSAVKNGEVFPPLIVFHVTDRKFPGPILVAGFHRIAAFKRAGITSHDVDVRTGTYSEAWLVGYQSNLTHGLRYTNLQKRSAVETALKLYRKLSSNSLAEKLSVSHTFVSKIRAELVLAKEIEDTEKVETADGRTFPKNRGGQLQPLQLINLRSNHHPPNQPLTARRSPAPEPIQPETSNPRR